MPPDGNRRPAMVPASVARWALIMIAAMATALLVPLGVWIVAIAGVVLAMRTLRHRAEPVDRRRRRELAAGFLIAFAFMLVYYAGSSMWAIASRRARMSEKAICMTHVKTLAGALQMYLTDNDDAFPLATTWCESVMPYVRSEYTFVCPIAPRLQCGYAVPSGLAGIRSHMLQDPRRTVALFESNQGWNAAGGPELLPKDPRHQGGDIYGFADGSTRWQHRVMVERLRWQPVVKATQESP